jgi:hypothetical protein
MLPTWLHTCAPSPPWCCLLNRRFSTLKAGPQQKKDLRYLKEPQQPDMYESFKNLCRTCAPRSPRATMMPSAARMTPSRCCRQSNASSLAINSMHGSSSAELLLLAPASLSQPRQPHKGFREHDSVNCPSRQGLHSLLHALLCFLISVCHDETIRRRTNSSSGTPLLQCSCAQTAV